MNFILWILNRIKKSILNTLQLGQGQWKWVEEYRRLILFHKGTSLIATVFGGMIWFMVAFGFSLCVLDTRQQIGLAFDAIVIAIPVFYVYHWLAALYEVYDTERL